MTEHNIKECKEHNIKECKEYDCFVCLVLILAKVHNG